MLSPHLARYSKLQRTVRTAGASWRAHLKWHHVLRHQLQMVSGLGLSQLYAVSLARGEQASQRVDDAV